MVDLRNGDTRPPADRSLYAPFATKIRSQASAFVCPASLSHMRSSFRTSHYYSTCIIFTMKLRMPYMQRAQVGVSDSMRAAGYTTTTQHPYTHTLRRASSSLSLAVDRLVTACFLSLRLCLTLAPWLAQLFLADLALSALLPAAVLLPNLTYSLSSRIAARIWAGIQRICVERNHARIIIAGDQLPAGESAIVVANHVEWTDFYMIQALAQRSGMLGNCRWFAKQQLRWVPFLGWGLWAMGMPLVSRTWAQDKREIDRVFESITSGQCPVCKSCLIKRLLKSCVHSKR